MLARLFFITRSPATLGIGPVLFIRFPLRSLLPRDLCMRPPDYTRRHVHMIVPMFFVDDVLKAAL